MKRLFIYPLDVLMFRTYRPFTAGESHVAKTEVISPRTFEGAIKSKLFLDFCSKKGYNPSQFQLEKKRNENSQNFKNRLERFRSKINEKMENDAELRQILKTIGYSLLGFQSELTVTGVFYSQLNGLEEYFPIPNDLMEYKKPENNVLPGKPVKAEFDKLKPKRIIKKVLSYGTKGTGGKDAMVPLLGKNSHLRRSEGLLPFGEFSKYLNGEIPLKKIDFPASKEIRPGVALEHKTKKAVEGALYSAEFMRLELEWGFVVWYEYDHSLDGGLLKLGGEGRGAVANQIEDKILDFSNILGSINKEKRFKLYVATPSYFEGCVPPADILQHRLDVEQLELVAALPGKPVYVGGYDIALNREKPLRRWVQAGSVFFYQFDGKIKNDLDLPLTIRGEDIDMRCACIARW
jgi:CRISPR type III-B/RAMP module-associated protein Cmr3